MANGDKENFHEEICEMSAEAGRQEQMGIEAYESEIAEEEYAKTMVYRSSVFDAVDPFPPRSFRPIHNIKPDPDDLPF